MLLVRHSKRERGEGGGERDIFLEMPNVNPFL